jgi:hypothetical protein
MTDIAAFPIPTKILDPSEYPEFKGEPGDAGPATEWQSTATHLQARPVGGDTWVDVVALSEITGPEGQATAAQGAKADSAIQPPAVSTIAIAAGAISTPLDGSAYRLTLSADVAAGWSAPLPSGGDASAQVYWASLDILPPTSGGPFALSIPAGWLQAGPLDTIALAAGDDPVSVTLRTWGAADIAYSAGWVGA